MINFLFRKKVITLACFTFIDTVYERFAITESINYIPEWFKKLPTKRESDAVAPVFNVRKCSGMLDLFNKGAVVPLPCDVKIVTWHQDSEYYVRGFNILDNKNIVLENFGDYFHKLTLPWLIKQKTNIPFLLTNCHYHSKRQNITVLNGVTNFHYIPYMNMFFSFI